MRVLVATTAGTGHFAALAPFAAALRDAGHAVRVAAPASFGAVVRKAGFEHVSLADPLADEIGPISARLRSLSRDEANAVVAREMFGGIDARAAFPGMQATADAWRPDLILREAAEFASYIVAERTGTPQAQVAWAVASAEQFMEELVDEPLRALGSTRGVAGLADTPHLTLMPASLDEAAAEPRPTYRFRYARPSDSGTELPSTWWPDFGAPLVYVSFGSVTAGIGFFPDFYRAVLGEMADLPVRVLLTLGEGGDPERLGPVPANTHVERWWPQEQVMAHASAVVGHGGFGTTMEGLSAGVPMVVLPLFAMDQFANAARVQAVGAGIGLEEGPAAVGRIREALERVLGEPAYRAGARRVAEEIERLPQPSACVPLLVDLATRGTRAVTHGG